MVSPPTEHPGLGRVYSGVINQSKCREKSCGRANLPLKGLAIISASLIIGEEREPNLVKRSCFYTKVFCRPRKGAVHVKDGYGKQDPVG